MTANVMYAPAAAGGGCFNVWTSETLTGGPPLWGQVGFDSCNDSSVNAFIEVWGPTGGYLIDVETVVSLGLHQFSMYWVSGTTWAFAVDGNPFTTYDMQSTFSNDPQGMATQVEQCQSAAPYVPPAVEIPVALEVMSGSTWGPASAAEIYDTTGIVGVIGNLQDGTLADNQVIVGGTSPYANAGTSLWNGTDTQGGLDAAVPSPSSPPFLTVTCPTPGTTLGGTIAMTVNASAPLGVTSVAYWIDQKLICTATAAPFGCSWDSTQAAAGSHSAVVWLTDAQSNSTSAYFDFNVDQSAPSACSSPTEDAGTSDDAGAPPSQDAGAPTSDEGGALAAEGGARGAGEGGTSTTDAATTQDAASTSGSTDAAVGADGAASTAGGGEQAGSSSPSGCSCDLTGLHRSSSGWQAAGVLVLLAAGARRRRLSRCHPSRRSPPPPRGVMLR
jgi:hypothetical protein